MAEALSRDPYKNYRFRVLIDDKAVAGMNKVGSLSKKTESVTFRFGDDKLSNSSTPGLTTFEPITLTGGLTGDPVFHAWANMLDPDNGYEKTSGENVRKDIAIEVCDDTGNPTMKYNVTNCWVSEYKAMPDLNSTANDIAVQSITLQHEGIEKV